MKTLITCLYLFITFSFLLGLFLAFKVSIILGIIGLFVLPINTIIGVVFILTGTNLAEHIARLLGLL